MVHHDWRKQGWSAPRFGLVSFQFFQKCPHIDLTLAACLSEIEMKFQYGALLVQYSSKNRNRNRNSLNKHFTSKTYGDELVFDQITSK